MRCASVTSTYELALIASIPRGTLQRWLSRKVRLPFSGVKQIVDGLAEHAKRTGEAQQALADLTQLCPISDPLEERLRTEFRARGARFKSAMAAIEAAGLRLVPVDEPVEQEQSQSKTLAQSRETTGEDAPAA